MQTLLLTLNIAFGLVATSFIVYGSYVLNLIA